MTRDGRPGTDQPTLGTDQPTLDGPRVRLRPWRPDDADAVLAACQDAEIQRWTRVPVPYRRADADEFVTAIAPATWAEGGAQFAVVGRVGGELLGSIALFPPRDGVAECGYYALAGYRGQGLTAEALRVLAGWAFDDRGLRRLELRVHPRNTASRRVGEAAGFVVEGTLRQRSLHRGQPVDDVVLGLLANDPRPAPGRSDAPAPPGASAGTSVDRVT